MERFTDAVRCLLCTPLPQDCEQAEKADQFPKTQFMGQACWLQASVSRSDPLHGAPPLAGYVRMLLLRVWLPPPQVAEQPLKPRQVSQTQSTAQACELQDCMSWALPEQFAPPLAAATAMTRTRVWFPPAQEALQALKAPQDPQAQSTGHDCVLHGPMSMLEPWHALPPPDAATVMDLVRV